MGSTSNDSGTSNQFSKPPLKELVTPYKICLMVLVHEYCDIKLKSSPTYGFHTEEPSIIVQPFTEKEKRDFMTLILKLLQSPDLELKDLKKELKDKIRSSVQENVLDRFQYFRDEGVGPIMDFFQTVHKLIFREFPSEHLISKSSVLGLFFRRMILEFDKLTFSQVSKLHANFRSYFDTAVSRQGNDSSDEKSLCDSAASLSGIRFSKDCGTKDFDVLNQSDGSTAAAAGLYSQKQAEYFISQQGFLLQHNESEALAPSKLQEKISSILEANPDLSEAHFLSYLNNLRVKEYCTAVDNLYHYFDRNTNLLADGKDGQMKAREEDMCRRYAALNLAALHYRFGHKEESVAALHEAIRIAQENNDHICLQHALAWLHRLENPGSAWTASIMERSIVKSGELSLPYLASLGVQALARHNAFATAKPSSVFEFLLKSDILNCQLSQAGFMCISGAQKAGLWQIYGKSECCSMVSQLVMNLDTSENNIYHNGEAVCISLCNIARLHADKGQYTEALDIINNAKQRFPQHSQWSTIWMECEQEILFDRTVVNRKFGVAEQAVLNLRALNEDEADFRSAVLEKEQGEVTKSLEVLQKLSGKCKNKENHLTPDFYCRVLCLMGELYIQTGNYSMATNYVLECITHAKLHHLQYHISIATVHLALIQLMMHMPSRALDLLDEQMITILTHGSLLDQARTTLCYAKCQVAAAAKDSEITRKAALLSAVSLVNTCIEQFRKVEAFHRLKDALYYQARLYHDLGYNTERNKCAYQFKQLDQQHPTLNKITISAL